MKTKAILSNMALSFTLNLAGCCEPGNLLAGICVGDEPVEEVPCEGGETGGNGGETGNDGGEGGVDPEGEGCQELSCVEGPLLCTDAVCVCSATAQELLQGFGDAQVASWMNEGQLGTINGTCEGVLYPYNCLLGDNENSQIYHGGTNESWQVGQFWCAACYNRANELADLNGTIHSPDADAYEISEGWHAVAMCVRPSDVVDGWPRLRPTYAGPRILLGGDLMTDKPICHEGEIGVKDTTRNGPLCFGLIDCSLFCGSDDGCAEELAPLTDILGRLAHCALPPLDPSNVQAACGITSPNGEPNSFVSTPDLILDLTWDQEVSCISSLTGGIDCSLSQAMLDALLANPHALFGGSFLEISETGESIEVLGCNLTSACDKLGGGEGDAIIHMGTEWGMPTDPDVALSALSELRLEGRTQAVVRQGSNDVVYTITVVPELR